MEINRDIKSNFREFCNVEFPNKSCKANEKNNTNWFFVQAGTQFGDKLHYEFYEDYVQLHIEINESEQLQRFLFEQINDDKFKWVFWNKPNHSCRYEKGITNFEELKEAFLLIRNKIEPIIMEFERQQNSSDSVELYTKTLGEIFHIRNGENIFELKTLSIPDYQRAYEWKTDHVKNLFNDTFDASQKKNSYLMGTLILHNNGEVLEIVDGQQRLITLTILIYTMGEIDHRFPLLNSKFDNIKSHFYIQNTKKELQTLLNGKTKEQKEMYLEFLICKLRFSVLIISGSNALDKSYTFFDSLNSKGKGLSDFDLLKAHHLMFIPEEQESLARKHNDYWQINDSNHQRLFSTILRRIRMWSRGMERDSKADRNDFYEFISTVEPSELEQDEHFFNRYMQPNAFRSWCRENDEIVLNLKTPQADSELLLPMEIPQTIEGGDSFFLYTKRYHGLYNMLFGKIENNKSTAIQFVSDLSKAIVNDYLRMTFEAATLLFYDKFGEKKLVEVATCVELIISEKRFEWGGKRPSPIRIEGVLSDVKNKNIIPIILNSTISSHVVSQLKEKIKIEHRIHKDSPTLHNYWNQINNFYQYNKSKIKNTQILEALSVIYNSELKGVNQNV